MVIAIIKEVDHTRAGINFIKAEVSGKTMKVQFDVTDPGSPVNNDNTILATVPRVAGLSKVFFIKAMN